MNSRKVTMLGLLVIFLIALNGCSSVTTKANDNALTADISGLVLDEAQLPRKVYKNPKANSLASYKRFIVDQVQINYTDTKMKELDPELVFEIQQHFQKAMVRELRDGGYVVGTRIQADTLRIKLTLSGLKAPSASANVTSVLLPFSVSVGEVTIQAEFFEALSNRLDAVVIEGARGARALNTTPWSTKQDIFKALDRWAKGFREAVDKSGK